MKVQSKMNNPDKLETQGQKTHAKQNHNTICAGHHQTQTNTNNANKTDKYQMSMSFGYIKNKW